VRVIVCTVPSGAKVFSAVCGSSRTRVAPARPAPKDTSPTTVTDSGLFPIRALVRSPTFSFERSKVVLSTAISDLFVGPRPCTTLITGSSS
jgi:hypothetical protein